MKTFYINTSTLHTTIALFENDQLKAEKRWKAEHNEAELLQPAVEKLLGEQNLKPDEINQLVVCVGPGGFTSCRVGVSAVNAWSFSKGIPVASVSVFDLYPGFDGILVVSANTNEAWVRMPGENPKFVNREGLKLPSSFSFGGIVNEEWKTYFDEHGGSFAELEEQLPSVNQLPVTNKPVTPWYYKDPNITWSEKNLPIA
ncbi:MAG: tRNA (adenosine(37)-N6)-threonylcarbamoyltransferase complex dimerization subunit type 1 TsaB [Candidatus Gracilibacteria bacterium]|nr:tRNA (adenosine(37)-N6)-threonylcarbamoyltransferase complex dimerization subunit type 1 TsaB [bacterium]MDZ4217193.1 tRNA (adenosine(37)-N6)-threonylcarbamoyltransferase complex dimerization subunit type 1 TsaB [Candidatus Gracilibacteria bacterium]